MFSKNIEIGVVAATVSGSPEERTRDETRDNGEISSDGEQQHEPPVPIPTEHSLELESLLLKEEVTK